MPGTGRAKVGKQNARRSLQRLGDGADNGFTLPTLSPLVRLDEVYRAAPGFQVWLQPFWFNIFVEKLTGANVRD
jgi:hypothetical protein